MNTCQFVEERLSYHITCSVCGRTIAHMSVIVFGRDLIDRLICGEPCVLDIKEQRLNELIGQEGGRWDHLYQE